MAQQADKHNADRTALKQLYLAERFPEAVELAGSLLTKYPTDTLIWNILGASHAARQQYPSAIECFEKILSLSEGDSELYRNKALCELLSGALNASIDSYMMAIKLAPEDAALLNDLGFVHKCRGDLETAERYYRAALAVEPDFAGAHNNLSAVLLLSGQFAAGWHEYEWRGKINNAKKPHVMPSIPRWQGQTLQPEDELVLVSEQGLGDSIQFLRFCESIKHKSASRLSICLPEKLVPLVIESELQVEVRSRKSVSEMRHGYWLPLLSAPGILNVSSDNPLVVPPYLSVSPERTRRWGRILNQHKAVTRLVGINWQGNRLAEALGSALHGRSFPLEALAPLAGIEGISLLSLQKGDGTEQLDSCSFPHRFSSAQTAVDQALAFEDTAAVVLNCDLIITSDTAIAHLAGALGVEVWLLLQHVPDWRWGIESDRTFWYPGMHIYRQRRRGDWAEVINRVAADLAHWTPVHRR